MLRNTSRMWSLAGTLIVLGLVSTTAGALESDVISSQLFGGTQSDRGQAVRPTADGGLILTGETSSTQFGDVDVYLVKLDADRQVEWEYSFGGAANDRGVAVIQTADLGFAVAGYTDLGSNPSRNALLMKFNSEGLLQWQRVYGGLAEDSFAGVCQTGDGGFALVGTTSSLGGGGNAYYLVKADADGELVWERASGGGGDYLTAVVEDANGNLLASGYHKAGGTYTPPYDAVLMKRSGLGALVWIRTYDFSDYDRAYDLMALPQGGYVLSGPVAGGMGLWKVDTAGWVQWRTDFHSSSGSTATSLWANADGSFLVGGYSGSDTFVGKADAGGNEIWSRNYGSPGLDYCTAICATADGRYAVFGSAINEDVGFYDMRLLILEGLPTLTPVEDPRGGKSPALTIQGAYPNPFNPRTRLAFELPRSGQTRVEVFDTRGHRVAVLLDRWLDAGGHEVNWTGRDESGGSVAAGVYFARLSSAGQVRSYKLALVK